MEQEWIPQEEAAIRLSVATRTLQRYIKQGKLEAKAIRQGERVIGYAVNAASLREFAGLNETPAATETQQPPETSTALAPQAYLVPVLQRLSETHERLCEAICEGRRLQDRADGLERHNNALEQRVAELEAGQRAILERLTERKVWWRLR